MSIMRIRINTLVRDRAKKSPYSLSEITLTAMKRYLNGEKSLLVKRGCRLVSTSVNIPAQVEADFKILVKNCGLNFDGTIKRIIEEEMEERGI